MYASLLSDTKILFVIGDIVGKGTQASLRMSMIYTMLNAIIPVFKADASHDILKLVQHCNTVVCPLTHLTHHVPCFFGILDTSSRLFTYINAGHEPAHLLRNGVPIALDTPGFPLGADQNGDFESKAITLINDDRIVAFTDGFTDLKNNTQDRFNIDNLLSLMISIDHEQKNRFVDRLVDTLTTYQNRADQADDMAFVSIKIH